MQHQIYSTNFLINLFPLEETIKDVNKLRIKKASQTLGIDIYLLKVNNGNTRIRCEICIKVTIKTPERCQWRRSAQRH